MSLQVEDIQVSMGEKKILNGVSCEFKDLSLNLIIGENGCGKTTFIKSFFNQSQNFKGSIRLQGHPINPVDIFTNKNFFSVYLHEETFWNGPVKEYLNIGNDTSFKEKDFIEIAHLLERNFNHLSSGQKQAVCLSKVLNKESKVLFLDEPFSFLDIKQKEIYFQKVKEASQKKIIVMISHDWDYLKAKVDEIFILHSHVITPFNKECINTRNPLL